MTNCSSFWRDSDTHLVIHCIQPAVRFIRWNRYSGHNDQCLALCQLHSNALGYADMMSGAFDYVTEDEYVIWQIHES